MERSTVAVAVGVLVSTAGEEDGITVVIIIDGEEDGTSLSVRRRGASTIILDDLDVA